MLFTQRNRCPPILFHVQAARPAQEMIEIELVKPAQDPLVGEFAFASRMRKNLSQRSWWQIWLLGEEENVSRTKDAPLACSPYARRRHEKRISRTRIRSSDKNAEPERDRCRKLLE